MIQTTPLAPPTPDFANGDSLYEIVNGQRLEKAVGAFEISIASVLTCFIEKHARTHRIGRSATQMLFLLDADLPLKRRPDVAFVSYERWPRERGVPRTEAWEIVPELMVEVVSPSNSAVEIQIKVQEYFRYGAVLVWVIYPVERIAYVYESVTKVRVLTDADSFDGGNVLPGFSLKLTDLLDNPSD